MLCHLQQAFTGVIIGSNLTQNVLNTTLNLCKFLPLTFSVGTVNFMNNRNPMALVREYIENEGLRLVDFFRLMDKDHGGSISRQEFLEGLQVKSLLVSLYLRKYPTTLQLLSLSSNFSFDPKQESFQCR